MAVLEKEKDERERCSAREREIEDINRQREGSREEELREREKARVEERRREWELWVRGKEQEMALQKKADGERAADCELKVKALEKMKEERAAQDQATELERARHAAEAAEARRNASSCQFRLQEELSRCSIAANEVSRVGV